MAGLNGDSAAVTHLQFEVSYLVSNISDPE